MSQSTLTSLRAHLASAKDTVKNIKAQIAQEQKLTRESRARVKVEKRALAIVKAEARLAKLKSPPVGTKANAANKRPSKAIVTKFVQNKFAPVAAPV